MVEVVYEGEALKQMQQQVKMAEARHRVIVRRSTIQIGSHPRNIIVEHRRIEANRERNRKRKEAGKHEW